MRIICSKDKLQNAVSQAMRAVANRSTLALLDGILFVAENDTIKLTGYDLETGIVATLPGDIQEEGSVVLTARILSEIVRKLPEDVVSIHVDDNYVAKIDSGNSHFEIKGLNASDYPQLPDVDASEKVIVNQNLLKSMISQTLFAVSQDISRPAFNGILFNSSAHELELVAVDGFRLALRSESMENELPESKILIPGKALRNIQSILGDTGDVALYTTQNHIEFDMGDVKLISRLIQQEFMNYNSILPKSYATVIEVNRQKFYNAVDRANLILPSDDRRYPMSLSINGSNKVKISASTDLGNLNDEVELLDFDGDELEIDFNPRYFIDALKEIDDETVRLEFNGQVGPCVIKPREGDSFSYLVLPLRK